DLGRGGGGGLGRVVRILDPRPGVGQVSDVVIQIIDSGLEAVLHRTETCTHLVDGSQSIIVVFKTSVRDDGRLSAPVSNEDHCVQGGTRGVGSDSRQVRESELNRDRKSTRM